MTPRPTQPKEIGVSLTQDAWRRLRKSWAAMASLWTLVAVVLLAFFTPLLPLAPPDRDATQLMLAAPVVPSFSFSKMRKDEPVTRLFTKTFKFDSKQIEDLGEPIAAAKTRLKDARREYAA